LLLFQQYTSFGEKYPVNVSLNSLVEIYLKVLGVEIKRELISVTVVSLLAISLWAIYRSVHIRSQYEIFTLVMIIPILFIGTAFHYYLFVLLIPMAILVAQATGEVPMEKFDISNLISSRIRASLALVTLTSCLLPWSLSSGLLMSRESHQGANISLSWEVARIALAATFALLVFVPMKLGPKAID
jgi:asparagine N-glycosylation enzyme membrane subunit Stt3